MGQLKHFVLIFFLFLISYITCSCVFNILNLIVVKIILVLFIFFIIYNLKPYKSNTQACEACRPVGLGNSFKQKSVKNVVLTASVFVLLISDKAVVAFLQ